MAYNIYDIRVAVIRELKDLESGEREAYLSGLISGLAVQDHWMIEEKITYFDEVLVDFLASNKDEPIDQVLKRFGVSSTFARQAKPEWFIGESLRRSRFGNKYLVGLSGGMSYVASLFHAFYEEDGSYEQAAKMANEYLKQVKEWMIDELFLRSHVEAE